MMWHSRLSALRRQLVQVDYWQRIGVMAALIAAAIAVTYSVHKSRQYLHQLQVLQAERDSLEVEWGQLLLEQQAWGAYARVGKIAVDELGMRNPAPHDIMMVRP